jgi:hypothetical protein
MLVSLLDVRDLLALRLVSRKTKDWVEAVLPRNPTKPLTLYVKKNTLDELMEHEFPHGIPFFRGLTVGDTSFFSHPLVPKFLAIYGSQIQTVHGPEPGYRFGVVPDEVAFYEALPNLTQLTAGWLGGMNGKMPALQRLKLHTLRPEFSNGKAKVNFDFLQNLPHLTHLWLPRYYSADQVEVLRALGSYLKKQNTSEGSSRRTLTISLRLPYDCFPDRLNSSARATLTVLLQELAVADGRILIEYVNVKLLDEAVRHFHHQRGGQLLLRNFGKCVRSLIGFSSSLCEVELPNMLKYVVNWNRDGTTAMNGDFSRTVSWPKMEEIQSNVRNECLAKLLFGSGVFRPSVKRLTCDLKDLLLSLGSKEAHLLLANFPNLTTLELEVTSEVGLFRSVMRVLPTSCPKIQFLKLDALFPLGDEDFFGVDEEGGLTTPPLLQLPGKYIM